VKIILLEFGNASKAIISYTFKVTQQKCPLVQLRSSLIGWRINDKLHEAFIDKILRDEYPM